MSVSWLGELESRKCAYSGSALLVLTLRLCPLSGPPKQSESGADLFPHVVEQILRFLQVRIYLLMFLPLSNGIESHSSDWSQVRNRSLYWHFFAPHLARWAAHSIALTPRGPTGVLLDAASSMALPRGLTNSFSISCSWNSLRKLSVGAREMETG